jgi:hypothetical protein
MNSYLRHYEVGTVSSADAGWSDESGAITESLSLWLGGVAAQDWKFVLALLYAKVGMPKVPYSCIYTTGLLTPNCLSSNIVVYYFLEFMAYRWTKFRYSPEGTG